MESNTLISVIVPVYNIDKYLARCLDSICNNTYKDLEIICINDGSQDSSLEILKEYGKKDRRVIVIDQVNKNVSAARNAGLEVSKGQWIAFIDPDDWIHPQYFEALMFVANKENADIVNCNSAVVFEQDAEKEIFEVNSVQYKVLSRIEFDKNQIARTRVWGKLYRRDVISSMRFISGAEPIEDYCFNTMLFSSDMKFCYLDKDLYYYFMRSNSAIHLTTGRQTLAFVRYILPCIKKETENEKKQIMIKRCFSILLSSRYLEMYSKDFDKVNALIENYLDELGQYRKCLPIKEQIKNIILVRYPGLYRQLRIHDDPTLLEHEESLKNRANEI